jgi:dTDP-4-dehydrorhamnose 3,5-epimerase
MALIIGSRLSGVTIVETKPLQDERGQFSRIFCDEELLGPLAGKTIKQINLSTTVKVGSIRGLHYQKQPCAEIKIVRCLKGKVFDVAVDLRHDSPSFLHWFGIELSAKNNRALVIPEGCAHGFQVLEANSELLYLHTAPYSPSYEAAIRFDDPAINIVWPLTPTEISQRDRSHPYLKKGHEGLYV